MRPDQIQQLQDLSERLADRFIDEADPDEWAGHGKLPIDMTKEERGDAYWCKKNAMATGGVLRYVLDLRTKAIGVGDTPAQPDVESDMDRSIREAQQRAGEAVNRALKRVK